MGSRWRGEKNESNVSEEIMVESFPYLGTGDRPNQGKPKQTHTKRYTIIKMTNVKDKEKTLKEARKRKSFLSGNPHNAIS